MFNSVTPQKDTPLHLFVSGPGGVGQSFLTKLIIAWIDQYCFTMEGILPVLVCAPTGTAARNIQGETIHSMLKIPMTKYTQYSPLHPYTLQLLRMKFSAEHTVIIDEISMVSDDMLTVISQRLREIADCEEPFGGLNIIVVGDLFQLRPVLGFPVYKNTILWPMFKPFFLRENVRQVDDPDYARFI